jgi:adenine-specific DNA-methyltransferase
MLDSEEKLVRAAVDLGAADIGGPLSIAEMDLARSVADYPAISSATLRELRSEILAGRDPLGEAFCFIRDQSARRVAGAIYTPSQIVTPMVEWILDQTPGRIVDAGVGSGRFLSEVIRRRHEISAVAVDIDPVATLMTRAVLAVLKVPNVRVTQGDYTTLFLPAIDERTAFIGNPPYVRHHQLSADAKAWAQKAARSVGLRISGLAGLHAYFYLATAIQGRRGDIGCFVTSAEWLDVNYGAIMRSLVLGRLGGRSLHVVEPKALPFEGTQTTAVITTFEVGSQAASVRVQDAESTDDLKDLSSAGRPIARSRLEESSRWTDLLRSSAKSPEGFIQLGELCRVHRGAVTGANAVWVLRHSADLPDTVLYRSITRARELFAAGSVLADDQHLRLVVDLPSDLDELDRSDRDKVARFIKAAKKAGADKGYIAAHRRAWWSVGLGAPAPILATYMARRPPAFVMNAAEARHLNIAHGLYPRQQLDRYTLARLAEALRLGTTRAHGRVYAGGLIKFEPKEMERLMIPDLGTLTGHDPLPATVDA